MESDSDKAAHGEWYLDKEVYQKKLYPYLEDNCINMPARSELDVTYEFPENGTLFVRKFGGHDFLKVKISCYAKLGFVKNIEKLFEGENLPKEEWDKIFPGCE
jgi:hypothetical protein